MRRKDKAISNLAAIEDIVRKSLVCRLGLADENQPYVVPLSFGFKDNTLYFHSAPVGKKIDMLRRNNKVCFEFDIDHEVVSDEQACKWGMKFRSVIGYGRATIVEDAAEKIEGLDSIMEQYSNMSFAYPEATLENTLIIKVEIESMAGKQSGY